jgi:hypothetical protein
MRNLTSDELKAVSGGVAMSPRPRHPLLALIVAIILKAIGRPKAPPTRAVEAA